MKPRNWPANCPTGIMPLTQAPYCISGPRRDSGRRSLLHVFHLAQSTLLARASRCPAGILLHGFRQFDRGAPGADRRWSRSPALVGQQIIQHLLWPFPCRARFSRDQRRKGTPPSLRRESQTRNCPSPNIGAVGIEIIVQQDRHLAGYDAGIRGLLGTIGSFLRSSLRR